MSGSWTPPPGAIKSLADELAEADAEDRASRSIQPPAKAGICDCALHHRDSRWTGWELCTASLPGYLVHDDYGYSIALGEITGSAQMLDWIYQIRAKGWTDDYSHLTGLLRAFYDIFRPQASLCTGGRDRRLSTQEITRRVEQVLAAWPQRVSSPG